MHMKKVKLSVCRSGPGLMQNRGDVVEMDDDEAERIIAKGHGELFREARTEKAVPKAKVEKAAK